MSTVLVTGGSGFVGSHVVVLQLLNAGHDVRTTVRSLKKEESVRAMLRAAGGDAGRLTVFSADLTSESGWPDAMAGCDHVIHVASPLSDSARQAEADVIAAARDGSLRVLRAAREANVKRVVMTSSCGAVYYGYPPRAEPFDETNWSNPDRGKVRNATSAKARRVLAWKPRPREDAIVATAESLLKFGIA